MYDCDISIWHVITRSPLEYQCNSVFYIVNPLHTEEQIENVLVEASNELTTYCKRHIYVRLQCSFSSSSNWYVSFRGENWLFFQTYPSQSPGLPGPLTGVLQIPSTTYVQCTDLQILQNKTLEKVRISLRQSVWTRQILHWQSK